MGASTYPWYLASEKVDGLISESSTLSVITMSSQEMLKQHIVFFFFSAEAASAGTGCNCRIPLVLLMCQQYSAARLVTLFKERNVTGEQGRCTGYYNGLQTDVICLTLVPVGFGLWRCEDASCFLTYARHKWPSPPISKLWHPIFPSSKNKEYSCDLTFALLGQSGIGATHLKFKSAHDTSSCVSEFVINGTRWATQQKYVCVISRVGEKAFFFLCVFSMATAIFCDIGQSRMLEIRIQHFTLATSWPVHCYQPTLFFIKNLNTHRSILQDSTQSHKNSVSYCIFWTMVNSWASPALSGLRSYVQNAGRKIKLIECKFRELIFLMFARIRHTKPQRQSER